MRLVGLGFVLGASCVLSATSFAGKSSGKNCLDQITPMTGYRYFSGKENPWHNHPAMFASGTGDEATLTVLGMGFEKAIPLSDTDAAFAAYRALLIERGYTPTGG